MERLSKRERECLDLVARGASNPEIAARLGVARTTVHTQLNSAYRRLGLTDLGNPRAAAAALWAARGERREGE